MPKTCEIINDKHKGDKDKVGKSKNDNNKKAMDKGDKIENDFIYLYITSPHAEDLRNNQSLGHGQR